MDMYMLFIFRTVYLGVENTQEIYVWQNRCDLVSATRDIYVKGGKMICYPDCV